MHGLWGIKTAEDDKHSDPTDLEFLCFDISHRAIVYVLYDRRANDRPSWLKTGFTDMDIAIVGHTDTMMGYMETCECSNGLPSRCRLTVAANRFLRRAEPRRHDPDASPR